MDPILKALRDYRLNASSEQKAKDLARLERECLSLVDAHYYIYAVTAYTLPRQVHEEFNFDLSPDYSLDFSFC